jgi:hypothetical protein
MNNPKNLPRDASATAIQEANNFVLADATASPFTSPMTLTGSVQTLIRPANAAEFVVYPVTSDLKVSSDSTMTTYDLVTKGNKEPFPVANQTNIYIQGTASDVVYFRFHEV